MKGLTHIVDRIRTALRADNGSAAVSFILTFPIFLFIIAVIVQMTLMLNAKIVVTSAADAAARAAMTSLPDEQPQNVRHAALLVLAAISPEAKTSVASDASADADSLSTLGVTVPETFAARLTYAGEATTVTWSPEQDFSRSKSTDVEVVVVYRFHLSVPVAMRVVSMVEESVAGVTGNFWEVTGRSKVATSHGRKTPAGSDGWPG